MTSDRDEALAYLADHLAALADRVRAHPPRDFTINNEGGVVELPFEGLPYVRRALDGSEKVTITITWPPAVNGVDPAPVVAPVLGDKPLTGYWPEEGYTLPSPKPIGGDLPIPAQPDHPRIAPEDYDL